MKQPKVYIGRGQLKCIPVVGYHEKVLTGQYPTRTSIEFAKLPRRIINLLRADGIHTMELLLRIPEECLYGANGIAEKSVEKIRDYRKRISALIIQATDPNCPEEVLTELEPLVPMLYPTTSRREPKK